MSQQLLILKWHPQGTAIQTYKYLIMKQDQFPYAGTHIKITKIFVNYFSFFFFKSELFPLYFVVPYNIHFVNYIPIISFHICMFSTSCFIIYIISFYDNTIFFLLLSFFTNFCIIYSFFYSFFNHTVSTILIFYKL